jgi:hypothetical protein
MRPASLLKRGPAERGDTMTTQSHETVCLGELVEAAFDEAGQLSADPEEVVFLAAAAVIRMWLRGRKSVPAPLSPMS